MRRRLFLLGAAALATPALAAAAPSRIVSLNQCLDAMVLALADRRRIAALSARARDPQTSTIAEAARTLPSIGDTAEEVVVLRPDLVVVSRHTARATRQALERLGVTVEAFTNPKSVEESLGQVRRMSSLLGRPDRGEALVTRIEAAVAEATPEVGHKPLTALIYQPNGFAAGPGSLADDMMRLAGFENVARRYGLKAWGNVPLERILADPPQVLLVGEPAPGARSWADRVMTHPALRGRHGEMRLAHVPERYLYCGGPVLMPALAALAAARKATSRPA